MTPDKLTDHLIFRMARVAHAAMYSVNTRLEEAGRLSGSLQRILFHVSICPRISQGDLAARLGHTRAAISRQVALLEEGGYLRRAPGHDRRQIILSLTPAGTKEMEQALDIFLPVLDERLALLSAQERSRLQDLVAKLAPETGPCSAPK